LGSAVANTIPQSLYSLPLSGKSWQRVILFLYAQQ